MELIHYSFDPGIVSTGYVGWVGGEIVGYGNIKPKAADPIGKLIHLHREVTILLADDNMEVDCVAVEEFGKFVNPKTASSMMKCSEARATIIVASIGFARVVISASKGRMRKAESMLIAEWLGVKSNDHVADAVVIGLIAGFGKKMFKDVVKEVFPDK